MINKRIESIVEVVSMSMETLSVEERAVLGAELAKLFVTKQEVRKEIVEEIPVKPVTTASYMKKPLQIGSKNFVLEMKGNKPFDVAEVINGTLDAGHTKYHFQASRFIENPTVFGGNEQQIGFIKVLINDNLGFDFFSKAKEVDKQRLLKKEGTDYVMCTKLGKNKFTGYIGEMAWVWDMSCENPLVTPAEKLVKKGGHIMDDHLQQAYKNEIKELIMEYTHNKPKQQVSTNSLADLLNSEPQEVTGINF